MRREESRVALPAGSAPVGSRATQAARPPNGRRAPVSSGKSKRATSILARGEPMVWLTGGGLALSLLIIAGLLGLVLIQGFSTFWPRPLLLATLLDGTRVLGEATRNEGYRPGPKLLEGLPAEIRVRIEAEEGWTRRDLFRVGNYDMYGEDFRWISQAEVVDLQRPVDAWLLERLEWGVWIGWIDELRQDGRPAAKDTEIAAVLPRWLEAARERRDRIRRMEKDELGGVNREIEELRLELRRLDRQSSVEPERRLALEARRSVLDDEYSALQKRIKELRAEDARSTALLTEVGGRTKELRLSELVRAFQPNRMGPTAKLGVYLQRWREFLLEEPREANTEGGVMPAIFGTFMMTVIMSLAVAPFGIVTALYLREYARQGPLVSGVRIAVNNLAGVPSIVFGVFGLGFFCYTVGGTIDSVFFSERLPRPTFGTGGLLWASLTLALLTVPVVIVATEEALSAVPRSMREGSYACGASRWQTIRRIVLPRAAGGIMTGLILAMARGAGEVAPLMLTGVVKLAPELPLDGHFPYLHLERSFMHLGFHIYDVGFQSRNAEAAKPMVFTTTLLLIVLILTLNLTAIQLRKRLRSRFATAKF